jgi:Ni2+-binding GTPase involved in maturation of urease and hydrogenase
MSSAPFVWRADGRPDWRAMWTSFCDLALHGGPPHRGPDQPLIRGAGAGSDPEMVAEMRRGIWETTGLYSELVSPDWIAVTCESPAMADWLGTATAPENVEARVEADRLLLPAGPRFRLEDEVKSIITVVAKTHHYWTMHGGGARSRRGTDARGISGLHCGACRLDFRVSRPDGALDLEATCPVDGARMTRRDASFWHAHGPRAPYHPHEAFRPDGRGQAGEGIPRPLKVGVGGPGEGKTRLIDALRRRYGRRRAIVAPADRPLEVTDPAVDLVLMELGDEAPDSAPALVDTTIGVLDARAVARALATGDRSLEAWRLLVISTSGEPERDLRQLEQDACGRRGGHPVALVDLAAAEGVDAIASWFQSELLLDPWRERRARA